jgi:hypothetical protein
MPTTTYSPQVELSMRSFFDSLTERDRRHYAAVEAMKLGHGGVVYVASVLRCSERTVRRGLEELDEPSALPAGKSRKKGVDENLRSAQ